MQSEQQKLKSRELRPSLVFAIVGFLLSFIPFLNILGFGLSVTAIILAIISLSKKRTHRGADVAGLVIGIVGTVVVIIIFASIGLALSSTTAPSNSTAQVSSTSKNSSQTPTPKPVPTRQPKGTATTLGAGSFTGGTDVADGLYDVTTAAGQSGNFMVSGTDTYNEILGRNDAGGVDKIRVNISDGDQIQISSLSTVIFTPVTSAFVTNYGAASLYAGTFVVGQDIGAGRYTVTPGSGESGNFMVDGSDSYNEILGSDPTYGQVPSLTVNLADGDTITISGLDQVNFAPAN